MAESLEEQHLRHEKELAHEKAKLERELQDLRFEAQRKEAEDRRKFDARIAREGRRSALRLAWISAISALGAAFISGIVALLVAFGKKADPQNQTNFFGNIYNGASVAYRLANPKIPAADVLPRAPAQKETVPATPARVIAPVESSPAAPAQKQAQIPTATCAGLDGKAWSITIGAVSPMTTPKTKGYIVHLRLRNLTDQPIGLKQTGRASLTDSNGNSLGLVDSSIAIPNFGVAPTTFGADVDTPVSFAFGGATDLGSSVSFDVNLNSSTLANGRVVGSQITLGCTDLPVLSRGN